MARLAFILSLLFSVLSRHAWGLELLKLGGSYCDALSTTLTTYDQFVNDKSDEAAHALALQARLSETQEAKVAVELKMAALLESDALTRAIHEVYGREGLPSATAVEVSPYEFLNTLLRDPARVRAHEVVKLLIRTLPKTLEGSRALTDEQIRLLGFRSRGQFTELMGVWLQMHKARDWSLADAAVLTVVADGALSTIEARIKDGFSIDEVASHSDGLSGRLKGLIWQQGVRAIRQKAVLGLAFVALTTVAFIERGPIVRFFSHNPATYAHTNSGRHIRVTEPGVEATLYPADLIQNPNYGIGGAPYSTYQGFEFKDGFVYKFKKGQMTGPEGPFDSFEDFEKKRL